MAAPFPNRAPDRGGPIDVEWIAIKAGLKPANRISVAPEWAADVEARARREAFCVERAAELAEFPGRPPAAVLYVSPDPQRARDLAAAEAPLFPFVPGRLAVEAVVPIHARIGELLGFPACCVESFCARVRRDVTRRPDGRRAHEDFVAAECAARASQRFLGRLNDLSPVRRVRIVTFYPCRYDCPTASTYAASVFAHAERSDPVAAAALRAGLLGTASMATDGTRGGGAALQGEVLTIEFAEF